MHWRFYTSPNGARVVESWILARPKVDRDAIFAAMNDSRTDWEMRKARRVIDYPGLWEIRATNPNGHFRIIFGRVSRPVMLAVMVLDKNTDRTAPRFLRTAIQRLRDWEGRGNA